MTAHANLVHETFTGTGTGPHTLSRTTKQRVSGAFGTGDNGDDNPILHIWNIDADDEWMAITGYMSDADTLVVDTVLDSALFISGAPREISFSAGVKVVTNGIDAQRFISTEDYAGDAQLKNPSTANRIVRAKEAYDAAAEVEIVPVSGVAFWDMGAGINFFIEVSGATALEFPSNVAPGKSGHIRVVQAGAGGDDLTPQSSAGFVAGDSEVIEMSAGAGDEDLVFYKALSASRVFLTMRAGLASL